MAKSVRLQSLAAVSNQALKEDELPSRIKVLDWGKNKTLDGEITFDEQSAQVFYANQKSIGRTYAPLDFNHNTVPGTMAYKNDKEPRAVAGYGVPTIAPGDGLYYEYMQWTPSGVKSAKDFADLSPAVITDDDNRVIGLHSTALTPAGAIEGLSFYSAESIDALKTVAHIKPMSSKMDDDCDGDDDKKEDDDEDEDDDKEAKGKKAKMAKGKVKAHSSDEPYGSVEYADPGFQNDKKKRYPINTEEHVRAALNYINQAKNQKNYTAEQIASIKNKIAAKAKHYGIQLRAESADNAKVQVNAYVQDPYKGLDMEIGEHLEYFREKLGLPDGTEPDDIMKKLRAKWEGIEDADKQPLPEKALGSTVDPDVRNDGSMDKSRAGQPHGVITYDAVEALLRKSTETATKAIETKFEDTIKSFNAEIATLKAERDANARNAETKERESLIDEANRLGKVLPLSADELKEIKLETLRSIVKNTRPEVPLTTRPLKAMSADGKVPAVVPGSMQRASDTMTEYFAQRGLQARGKMDFTGVTTPGRS